MQTPIREIMATTSKDTSIRIKESTRFRLDMLKGNKSHDAFVAEMLLYFETTGITPQSNVMPPNIAAKEQASRVIEVVRGIEKSTNVRLKNIEQLLLSLVGEVKTPGDNPDEYMHISQVQELLERSKQLEQEARENRLQGITSVSTVGYSPTTSRPGGRATWAASLAVRFGIR